jgi:outer membrane protein assembly factor BamB
LTDDTSHLFIQTSNSIYSLNVDSGKILWQKEALAGPTYGASMKKSGDTLFASEKNETIAAYSWKTGETIWKDSPKVGTDWIDDMNINNNTIYVARYNGHLTAYDLSNGKLLWEKDIPDRTELFVMPDEEKVYLGTSASLFTYDPHTGELLGEYKLNRFAHYMEKKDETVYIANYKEKGFSFSALDLNTLETKWTTSKRNPQVTSSSDSMIFENDILYGIGNPIVAVSMPSGDILWISNKKENYKSAVINGNEIYAVDRSYLYILDKASGIEKKRIPLPGIPLPGITFPPLISWLFGSDTNLFISNDLLIVVSDNQVNCYKLPLPQ